MSVPSRDRDASLALFVPHQPRGQQSGFRHELRAMGNRQVAIGLATAVVGFGGFFAVYSYLVPMLANLTGISDSERRKAVADLINEYHRAS